MVKPTNREVPVIIHKMGYDQTLCSCTHDCKCLLSPCWAQLASVKSHILVINPMVIGNEPFMTNCNAVDIKRVGHHGVSIRCIVNRWLPNRQHVEFRNHCWIRWLTSWPVTSTDGHRMSPRYRMGNDESNETHGWWIYHADLVMNSKPGKLINLS